MVIAPAIMCLAFVTPLPVDKQKLHGAWIGFTPVPNDFYRIVLTNKSGFLAYSATEREPVVYRIVSWDLGPKGELKMAAEPSSANAQAITVTGSAVPWKLDLTIRSPGRDWQHNVTCYQEQLIENRIGMLKRAMAK